MFICVAIFGVATVIFGLSRSLWLSLAALSVSGAADTISVIIRGSLLQLATPPEMRGRVMSAYTLIPSGVMPLGAMVLGSIGSVVGVPPTVAVGAALVLVASGVAYLTLTEVRTMP